MRPERVDRQGGYSGLEWDSFPLAIPESRGPTYGTWLRRPTPTRPREDSDDLEFVVDETQTLVPVVNGDWFVAEAPSLRSTTRFWGFRIPWANWSPCWV